MCFCSNTDASSHFLSFVQRPLLFSRVFDLYLNHKPNKHPTLTSFDEGKLQTLKRHTHLPCSCWHQQQSTRLISRTLPHTIINSSSVFVTTKQVEYWISFIYARGGWPIFALVFWVLPLGGQVLWFWDLALFGNLSSSLLPSYYFFASALQAHRKTIIIILPPCRLEDLVKKSGKIYLR